MTPPSDNPPGGTPSRGQPRNPAPRVPVPVPPALGASPGPVRGIPPRTAPEALPEPAQPSAVQLTVPLSPKAFRVTIFTVPCLLILVVILLLLLLSTPPVVVNKEQAATDGKGAAAATDVKGPTPVADMTELINKTKKAGDDIATMSTEIRRLNESVTRIAGKASDGSKDQGVKQSIEDAKRSIDTIQRTVESLDSLLKVIDGRTSKLVDPKSKESDSSTKKQMEEVTALIKEMKIKIETIEKASTQSNKFDPKPLEMAVGQIKAIEKEIHEVNDKINMALAEIAREIRILKTNINEGRGTLDAATAQSLAMMQEIQRELSAPYDVVVVLSHAKDCDAKVAAVIGDEALAAAPSGAQYKNYRLGVVTESGGKIDTNPIRSWPTLDAKGAKVPPSYKRDHLVDPGDRVSSPNQLDPATLFPTPPANTKPVKRVVFVTSPSYDPPASDKKWEGISVDVILLSRAKIDTGKKSQDQIEAWSKCCREHRGAALVIPLPDDFDEAAKNTEKLRAHPAGKLLDFYLRRLTQPEPPLPPNLPVPPKS